MKLFSDRVMNEYVCVNRLQGVLLYLTKTDYSQVSVSIRWCAAISMLWRYVLSVLVCTLG
jgi:hypothetical protein